MPPESPAVSTPRVPALLLGPGARMEALAPHLVLLGASELGVLADLAETLRDTPDAARLAIDADLLPSEDVGILRRYLAASEARELVLVSEDPRRGAALALADLRGVAFLLWPPNIVQLAELAGAAVPGSQPIAVAAPKLDPEPPVQAGPVGSRVPLGAGFDSRAEQLVDPLDLAGDEDPFAARAFAPCEDGGVSALDPIPSPEDPFAAPPPVTIADARREPVDSAGALAETPVALDDEPESTLDSPLEPELDSGRGERRASETESGPALGPVGLALMLERLEAAFHGVKDAALHSGDVLPPALACSEELDRLVQWSQGDVEAAERRRRAIESLADDECESPADDAEVGFDLGAVIEELLAGIAVGGADAPRFLFRSRGDLAARGRRAQLSEAFGVLFRSVRGLADAGSLVQVLARDESEADLPLAVVLNFPAGPLDPEDALRVFRAGGALEPGDPPQLATLTRHVAGLANLGAVVDLAAEPRRRLLLVLRFDRRIGPPELGGVARSSPAGAEPSVERPAPLVRS